MHYKNGREVKIGDVVVGRTHNSQGKLRIGVVLETMEKQGPCNARLRIYGTGGWHYGNDEGPAPKFWGGHIHSFPHEVGKSAPIAEIAEDFADCKELVRVDDAYRAICAVIDYVSHDSPYGLPPTVEF